MFITHPWGGFSKLDCSTTKRVPIPNDTSSESSRRDVSSADLFGSGTIPTVEISTMEDRPRGGVIHRPIRVVYLIDTVVDVGQFRSRVSG